MAKDKAPSNTSEFDVLPESELEELVGGQPLQLKPISAKDFASIAAALCLNDPEPR